MSIFLLTCDFYQLNQMWLLFMTMNWRRCSQLTHKIHSLSWIEDFTSRQSQKKMKIKYFLHTSLWDIFIIRFQALSSCLQIYSIHLLADVNLSYSLSLYNLQTNCETVDLLLTLKFFKQNWEFSHENIIWKIYTRLVCERPQSLWLTEDSRRVEWNWKSRMVRV